MTESQDALIAAIRAQEKAEAAHLRLDRMNGSIDRLGASVEKSRAELGAKVDTLLIHQATQMGESAERQGLLRRRDFWFGIAVAALVGGVSAGTALAALFLQ